MATPAKNWKLEWEEQAKYARKLAKRANQRLLRLERYSQNEGFESITKYSYAKAEQFIRNFTGKKTGKPRFQEKIRLSDAFDANNNKLEGPAEYKANVIMLRHKIKAMEEFLGSESSTIGHSRTGKKTKGVKQIYSERAKTINQQILNAYGLEFTENDLKRFFNSRKQAKLEKLVGSKQQFVVAAVMKKLDIKGSRAELEEFVKTHVDLDGVDLDMKKSESRAAYLERMRKYLNYTDDPVLNDLITNALKEGINVKNIFI